MNEQHTSAIFGMNFLQEMKGETVEIIGEYDPEQQLWVVEGQVQAGGSNVYNPRSYTTFQTSRGSTNISFQTNHPDGGSTVDHSTQQDYKPDMNFYR